MLQMSKQTLLERQKEKPEAASVYIDAGLLPDRFGGNREKRRWGKGVAGRGGRGHGRLPLGPIAADSSRPPGPTCAPSQPIKAPVTCLACSCPMDMGDELDYLQTRRPSSM